MTAAQLKRRGWTRLGKHGWHRGPRCAGDRYWSLDDAKLIAQAEAKAGKTLWPRDPEWPEGVGR